MGKLYEAVRQIDAAIARKGLPAFKVKGLIAIRVGFSLALIRETTPDDPLKLAALRAAAEDVIGETIG